MQSCCLCVYVLSKLEISFQMQHSEEIQHTKNKMFIKNMSCGRWQTVRRRSISLLPRRCWRWFHISSSPLPRFGSIGETLGWNCWSVLKNHFFAWQSWSKTAHLEEINSQQISRDLLLNFLPQKLSIQTADGNPANQMFLKSSLNFIFLKTANLNWFQLVLQIAFQPSRSISVIWDQTWIIYFCCRYGSSTPSSRHEKLRWNQRPTLVTFFLTSPPHMILLFLKFLGRVSLNLIQFRSLSERPVVFHLDRILFTTSGNPVGTLARAATKDSDDPIVDCLVGHFAGRTSKIIRDSYHKNLCPSSKSWKYTNMNLDAEATLPV